MNIASYITTLTAVVIITTVSQLILPDGKMKKTAAVIFKVMIIISVVSPVLKSDITDEIFTFETQSITADTEAVENIKSERIKTLENYCENMLFENDICIDSLKIVLDENTDFITVKKVIVNLSETRITDEDEHINISRKTTELLVEALNVDEEAVFIE